MRGADGVRTAVWRFGGGGPPLVLVHGTGFHAHTWLPMATALRSRFTLFGLDLRGHGESEAPADPEAYHFDRLGGDVLAAIAQLGLGRVAAIGHSVGAAVLIAAELTRPGTIERAVLFEPIVLPPEIIEETPAASAAAGRRQEFASTEAMLARWSGREPFASFDPQALRCYVEHGVRPLPGGGVRLKCSRDAELATYHQDVRSGLWVRLGAYRPPTLVLAGETSTSRAAPHAEAIARRMALGRVDRVPGLGHFLPLERPGEMALRALDFLGRES